MEWLEEHMWPAERLQTADTAYIAAALTHLEFLESGITANADMWIFPDSTAKAALESGLRTFVCATVFSRPSTESQEPIKSAEDFVQRWKGREEETRVYPAYGPHAVYSCSQPTLSKVAELAKRDNVLIHTHISETEGENRDCFLRLGMSPTRAMMEVGIFESRVLAAHCVYTDEEDLGIFNDHDASISYNPISNLKLCSGILPLDKAYKANVRVSIGTDGPQSNNSLDLLRDLKTGTLIQKERLRDPTFLPAKQALRMATIDGAASLGMENEIGSLEGGKRADIVALGLDRANMFPMRPDDPDCVYSQIVYSASGANVTDVFVDGERLLKDRVPIRVDKEAILRHAEEASGMWRR
jgi:5-methylthioadenosine/S-adenosylhomocysteine deaminase